MCSDLVAYHSEAEHLGPWVVRGATHHTANMARIPDIRDIELCTRLGWCGTLPWPHVDHMLRNKVVFDAPPALSAAQNAGTRLERRADYATFPKFSGPVTHVAVVGPCRFAGEAAPRLRR